jgi:hypothetical protein
VVRSPVAQLIVYSRVTVDRSAQAAASTARRSSPLPMTKLVGASASPFESSSSKTTIAVVSS